MGGTTAPSEESDALVKLLREAAAGAGAAPWRKLCPWLRVEDEGLRDDVRNLVFPYAEGDPDLADAADTWSGDLVTEGYFTAGPDELPNWAVDVDAVARGIEALVAAGLPPSCILAFDEPWVMAAQLSQLVRVSSGGNEPIMDWAAFCVGGTTTPRADSAGSAAAPAGWPPHRDRGTDDAAANGFRRDGTPRYTTFWLALTDATPSSSCLSVVPKAKDPGYSEGDRGVSPLTAIFKTPEAFQHIRAVPVRAGGLMAFSHRLLHWGSAADPRAPRPRISIAFAAADAGFAEPYFPRSILPLPPLGLRLALIAGQALAYFANESVLTTPERADACWELFSSQATTFCPSFRRLVAQHHAALSASLREGAAAGHGAGGAGGGGAGDGASADATVAADGPAVGKDLHAKSDELEDDLMQDLFAGI